MDNDTSVHIGEGSENGCGGELGANLELMKESKKHVRERKRGSEREMAKKYY